MGAEAFTIRTMAPTEVLLALDWAAAEGWNPGLHDAEAFLAADPGGFLCGELNGQIVSCISAVRYGDDYGFMGFYIVRPEHRGRRFGHRTWLAGMARMGERRVGLDGVLAQVDDYRKSKFVWSHRNARYSLKHPPPPASYVGVEDLSAFPWAEILAFDRTCFPAPRVAFLERWLQPPSGKALGFRDAGGRLAGYGVIRACRTGAKIGPLFAETSEGARRLFWSLAAWASSGPVFLDVPETNADALALVRAHGMMEVFQTARMYRGSAPSLDPARIYGITSFELG